MKDFYKGVSKAGGHIPINGSYVVTGLLFTDLGKLNAPAFESTFILACKKIIG